MVTSGEKVLQWYRSVFLTGSICFPRPSSRVTIPTLWRPTAFYWVKDCGLSMFTLRNLWNPLCSLTRRFCCLFGVITEGSENLVSVNLFSFLCSLNLNVLRMSMYFRWTKAAKMILQIKKDDLRHSLINLIIDKI